MKIRLNSSIPFDLDATLCCGQAFRWDRQGEWWYGIAKDRALKIRQVNDELEFENTDVDFVKNYLGLQDNLPRIILQISKDVQIKKAVSAFEGLRILRQDPWECLVSYICATYKNIASIKKMLFNLSKKFGEKTDFDDYNFFTFPSSEALAKSTLQELAKCGLGYRARYVAETAKKVLKSNFDFEQLRKMSYEKAKEELLEFPGVGLKVADCVLLFSLGKLEAFPVDVWIKRVILRYYTEYFSKEYAERISRRRSLSNSEYEKLSLFGRKYFGEYAGYAQEYLYHYERMQH